MLDNFIGNIKNKVQDMKTISELCLGAEKYANQYGEEKPGAEHFMLASLDLQDGSAKKAFAEFGIDSDAINRAIKDQHNDALTIIGVEQEVIKNDIESSEKAKLGMRLYDTKPSGQTVMKKIYQNNKARNTRLRGVHILEAILSMEYGTAIRVLQTMKMDFVAFKKAIKLECNHI